MKKLTDNGVIDDEIEVEELDLPSKPKKTMIHARDRNELYPRKEARERSIENINSSPTIQKYGLKMVKKSTYMGLWIFGIVIFLLLATGIIWFLTSFDGKNFAPIVNNNIQPANITIPNNNEINVTSNTNNENKYDLHFHLDGNLSQQIANEVKELLNGT